jgi:hypothetical protein
MTDGFTHPAIPQSAGLRLTLASLAGRNDGRERTLQVSLAALAARNDRRGHGRRHGAGAYVVFHLACFGVDAINRFAVEGRLCRAPCPHVPRKG